MILHMDRGSPRSRNLEYKVCSFIYCYTEATSCFLHVVRQARFNHKRLMRALRGYLGRVCIQC